MVALENGVPENGVSEKDVMPSDDRQTAIDALKAARIVVIKVGSALLVDDKNNAINQTWLAGISEDIAALQASGASVVVVSSGAIALGSLNLGISQKTLQLEEKQAAAAAGQVTLAHAWMTALATHNIQTAQILLSPDDTETRRRHLNARATMTTLLSLGAVPVVNENDTVATAEIRFGDNDRLAARVAAMLGADMLVLLSDVDGLYTGNPHHDKMAEHIAKVDNITPEIMNMAGTANASYASGGMVTKLEAARIATSAGCSMIICNGRDPRPLMAIKAGARNTIFTAEASPPTARKKWIAGALSPKGKLVIDDGAVSALRKGRSLLPAGVTSIGGNFERGDLIAVESRDGLVIGHGLSAYSATDATRIKGHKSSEIETLLGYRGRDELIHADNIVMNDNGAASDEGIR
ncbi:glutamate 5-kinase [Candidatus Puniceispirillum sp.]|uniref:glutamate 5-kinase n=1 Tax=Candidatus Puniceispirillum sp. TaxID=2026719 RepID=UPI003F699EB3